MSSCRLGTLWLVLMFFMGSVRVAGWEERWTSREKSTYTDILIGRTRWRDSNISSRNSTASMAIQASITSKDNGLRIGTSKDGSNQRAWTGSSMDLNAQMSYLVDVKADYSLPYALLTFHQLILRQMAAATTPNMSIPRNSLRSRNTLDMYQCLPMRNEDGQPMYDRLPTVYLYKYIVIGDGSHIFVVDLTPKKRTSSSSSECISHACHGDAVLASLKQHNMTSMIEPNLPIVEASFGAAAHVQPLNTNIEDWNIPIPENGGCATTKPLWNLASLMNTRPGQDMEGSNYYYNFTGAGVTVYIIDKGVNVKHREFGGRADWKAPFEEHLWDVDTQHGTHVASVVGGATVGVAKGVKIIALPFRMTESLRGAFSSDFIVIVTHILKHATGPSVAVMSFTFNDLPAELPLIQRFVTLLRQRGVIIVAAAGNADDDACKYKPSGFKDVLTVGGMNKFGQRMSRSNYGECVDVYAPGECIIGASSRDPTDYIRMNGTSFAAPHVAGIVALMLEQDNHLTLEQVKERLKRTTMTQMSKGVTASDNYVATAPISISPCYYGEKCNYVSEMVQPGRFIHGMKNLAKFTAEEDGFAELWLSQKDNRPEHAAVMVRVREDYPDIPEEVFAANTYHILKKGSTSNMNTCDPTQSCQGHESNPNNFPRQTHIVTEQQHLYGHAHPPLHLRWKVKTGGEYRIEAYLNPKLQDTYVNYAVDVMHHIELWYQNIRTDGNLHCAGRPIHNLTGLCDVTGDIIPDTGGPVEIVSSVRHLIPTPMAPVDDGPEVDQRTHVSQQRPSATQSARNPERAPRTEFRGPVGGGNGDDGPRPKASAPMTTAACGGLPNNGTNSNERTVYVVILVVTCSTGCILILVFSWSYAKSVHAKYAEKRRGSVSCRDGHCSHGDDEGTAKEGGQAATTSDGATITRERQKSAGMAASAFRYMPPTICSGAEASFPTGPSSVNHQSTIGVSGEGEYGLQHPGGWTATPPNLFSFRAQPHHLPGTTGYPGGQSLFSGRNSLPVLSHTYERPTFFGPALPTPTTCRGKQRRSVGGEMATNPLPSSEAGHSFLNSTEVVSGRRAAAIGNRGVWTNPPPLPPFPPSRLILPIAETSVEEGCGSDGGVDADVPVGMSKSFRRKSLASPVHASTIIKMPPRRGSHTTTASSRKASR